VDNLSPKTIAEDYINHVVDDAVRISRASLEIAPGNPQILIGIDGVRGNRPALLM
jgi:hypothetical protein